MTFAMRHMKWRHACKHTMNSGGQQIQLDFIRINKYKVCLVSIFLIAFDILDGSNGKEQDNLKYNAESGNSSARRGNLLETDTSEM